ncbi:MAG TPA: hypothetical protein VJ608_11285, partial [Albitalea sp.]|nr:hypothetical protein [Albitalea sp.]
ACAFVVELGDDAIAVRGWPLGDLAAYPIVVDMEAACGTDARVRVTVVQSGATRLNVRHRLVYLPARLASIVQGEFEHAAGAYNSIVVRHGKQIAHIAAVAEQLGVQPRQSFSLTFDVSSRTYEIGVNGSAQASVMSQGQAAPVESGPTALPAQ